MRRLIARIALFLLLFSTPQCQIKPHNDVESGTPDDCAAACENLARLGCPGAQGSPGKDETFGTEDDVPCVEVCEEIMRTPPVSIHPNCVAAAKSCDAVERCFR